MNYYLKAFKECLNFQGRATQSEFWYFFLFNALFSVTAMVLDSILELNIPSLGNNPIRIIYTIIVFIPGLAVTVRRLHDTGKSGSYIFLVLIPVIGIIWLLLVLAGESHPGRNKYGERLKENKLPKTDNP